MNIVNEKELTGKVEDVIELILDSWENSKMRDSELIHLLVLKYGFFLDLSEKDMGKYLD